MNIESVIKSSTQVIIEVGNLYFCTDDKELIVLCTEIENPTHFNGIVLHASDATAYYKVGKQGRGFGPSLFKPFYGIICLESTP